MTIKEGKTVNKKVLMHYQTKKFLFLFYIYQKTKKCYKEKNEKTIKIFLKKKKTESINMLANNTESFLQKINLVKKKKTKNVNIRAIYRIIFQKKKKYKNHEYAHEKFRNLSEEEKDKKRQYAHGTIQRSF